MARRPTVQIKNAKRLVRKLRAIPLGTRRSLTKTIEDNAQLLAKEIRAAVPTSALPRDQGHLRDQIRWAVHSGTSLRAKVGFWGPVYRKKFFYARFLEYGTRFMKKRPFMRQTFINHRASITNDITRTTNEVLLRVALSRPPDS